MTEQANHAIFIKSYVHVCHCPFFSLSNCRSSCVMAWYLAMAASLSRFSSSCHSLSISRRYLCMAASLSRFSSSCHSRSSSSRCCSVSSFCFSRKTSMYDSVVEACFRRFGVAAAAAPLPENSAITIDIGHQRWLLCPARKFPE